MTTTIHDKIADRITSDSRWSAVLNENEILYIDDTPFEKLVDAGPFALVMAGDSILIKQWKEWISRGAAPSSRPPVERSTPQGKQFICVCLIVKPSYVLFDTEQTCLLVPNARFSGSGKHYAKQCWEVNKCAKKAIESAKINDLFSGGIVKFVDFNAGSSNLSQDTLSVDELHYEMQENGFVINKTTSEVIPMKEYKTKEDVKKGFETGSLVASAPVGDFMSPWDTALESKLDNAIGMLHKLISK